MFKFIKQKLDFRTPEQKIIDNYLENVKNIKLLRSKINEHNETLINNAIQLLIENNSIIGKQYYASKPRSIIENKNDTFISPRVDNESMVVVFSLPIKDFKPMTQEDGYFLESGDNYFRYKEIRKYLVDILNVNNSSLNKTLKSIAIKKYTKLLHNGIENKMKYMNFNNEFIATFLHNEITDIKLFITEFGMKITALEHINDIYYGYYTNVKDSQIKNRLFNYCLIIDNTKYRTITHTNYTYVLLEFLKNNSVSLLINNRITSGTIEN